MGAPVAIPVTALTPLILVSSEAPAADPTPAPVPPSDIVFADLTDVAVKREMSLRGPGIDVGDGVVFRNEISTADGARLVELTGAVTIVHVRPSDQRIFGFYREFLRFADGTARTMGIVDITATMAGREQVIPAYGISGRYRGMVGIRSYRNSSEKPETHHAEIVFRHPTSHRP
ncbi:hypothetical protein ACIGXM_26930 [Kitasatospora sp. NPDC052896]|uniref:allene oxide cyclase barrel-like domain-containing protein n=1 Tax=Kitasatospora sp. NPDC052896 TaxID=3364061 RepID=UPI0037C917AF